MTLSCLLWSVAAVLETAKTLVLQRISDAPAGIDQLHIRKNRVQIEMRNAPKRSIFLRAGKKIRKKKTLVRYGFADSLPGLNARKTDSKQIIRSALSDRNTERSLRYEIRRQGIQKISRDYEQGADADRLPHQQVDGALSSPIQPDSAHLHRQENPLLRHQKERCDRLYERP